LTKRNKPELAPEAIVDKEKDCFDLSDQNKPIYSDALFSHGDEVFIRHRGEQYRLRRTRSGKLILTK
jgi:hemin uptake protein HemP